MDKVIALLLAYKYAIMLPLAIVEGPIVIILGGFLSTMHLMNPIIVYVIGVSGDLIGDTLFYGLGRFGGRSLLKRGIRFGITEEKLDNAKKYFAEHHKRALVTAKLVHGIGISGLVAAGALKIAYWRYMRTVFLIALAQSAVLLTIGILFGGAYHKIGMYLDRFAATISIVALTAIALVIFYKWKNNGKK